MTSAKKTRSRKRTLFCFSRAGVGPSSPAFPAPRSRQQSRVPAGPGTWQRLQDTKATLTGIGAPPHDRRDTDEEHRAVPGLLLALSPLRGNHGERGRYAAGLLYNAAPAASPGDPSLATARDKAAAASSLAGSGTLPPSLFLPSRLPASPASRMRTRPGTAGKRSRAASLTAPFSPRRQRNCACVGPPPPHGRYRPLCRGARYPGQRCHSGDWPRGPRGGTRGAR